MCKLTDIRIYCKRCGAQADRKATLEECHLVKSLRCNSRDVIEARDWVDEEDCKWCVQRKKDEEEARAAKEAEEAKSKSDSGSTK